MKVEIGFDLAANGVGSWFTLDDPTKGELNNATYTLAGEVLVDVTDTVREVSIRRGRSRVLERFTAGNASVVLDNRDRAYDPLNEDSPYYGSITPRKMVRISSEGVSLFVGNVENYAWDYQQVGDATATVQSIDGFAYLAQAVVTPGTQTTTTPGARIGTVLTEAGWPSTQRSIDTGSVTLDQDEVGENQNVLNYIQRVELSEPGAFFISGAGLATFLSRTALQDYGSTGVTFGTAGIPFVEYRPATLTDEMKNNVAITWYGGTVVAGTAVAQDATSQAAYGLFDYSLDTLLDTEADAQDLADYLVAIYAQPTNRVDSITVAVHALNDMQAATVLGLELGDAIRVAFRPLNTGTPVDQVCSIDAITHSAVPGQHFITYTLSQSQAALLLDDPIFGVLDSNTLGF